MGKALANKILSTSSFRASIREQALQDVKEWVEAECARIRRGFTVDYGPKTRCHLDAHTVQTKLDEMIANG